VLSFLRFLLFECSHPIKHGSEFHDASKVKIKQRGRYNFVASTENLKQTAALVVVRDAHQQIHCSCKPTK